MFNSYENTLCCTSLLQEGGSILRCQHCSQTFTDVKSFQIHNFLDHHQGEGGTPPPGHAPLPARPAAQHILRPQPDCFNCNICGLTAPTQAAFQQVSCGTASLCYRNVILQHRATHVAFRPYICSHCDAGFTSLAQLESHTKLHS